MANDDIFGEARKHAQKALAQVTKEIEKREAELDELTTELHRWQAVLSADGGSVGGRSRARRRGGVAGGRRVSWDSVLQGLPKKFTIDDMMKNPAARSKGRPQAYPALTRWLDSKKVKRVGKGTYLKT